jgi:hypothetical protein
VDHGSTVEFYSNLTSTEPMKLIALPKAIACIVISAGMLSKLLSDVEFRSMGAAKGTAQPFPLWRLRSGP